MNARPLRLPPGTDLRAALEAAASAEAGGSAFVVAGIGSLVDARLRFADAHTATTIAGPVEILSLAGSLAENGAHLHMAIATADGRVFGGHVAYGNTVRTTAEVLLVVLPDWQLRREPDAATGYDELVARPRAKD